MRKKAWKHDCHLTLGEGQGYLRPKISNYDVSVQPDDPVMLPAVDGGFEGQDLGPGGSARLINVVEQPEVVVMAIAIHCLIYHRLSHVRFGHNTRGHRQDGYPGSLSGRDAPADCQKHNDGLHFVN